ncbi:MAG: heavy metal-associated domain-containing protein [Planctomycetota bacterium]
MRLCTIFLVAASTAAITLAGCVTSGTKADPARSTNATTLDPASTEPIAADSANLLVFGMSCPLCAHNVDKQLLLVDGVTRVGTDLGTGDIQVDFGDTRPSPVQLARAIERSGFTLQAISTR